MYSGRCDVVSHRNANPSSWNCTRRTSTDSGSSHVRRLAGAHHRSAAPHVTESRTSPRTRSNLTTGRPSPRRRNALYISNPRARTRRAEHAKWNRVAIERRPSPDRSTPSDVEPPACWRSVDADYLRYRVVARRARALVDGDVHLLAGGTLVQRRLHSSVPGTLVHRLIAAAGRRPASGGRVSILADGTLGEPTEEPPRGP